MKLQYTLVLESEFESTAPWGVETLEEVVKREEEWIKTDGTYIFDIVSISKLVGVTVKVVE